MKCQARAPAPPCGLSRTPQGVRGLKFELQKLTRHHAGSHPARGAWIEIATSETESTAGRSHPARGAWIEILRPQGAGRGVPRRTPQGVRGLKFFACDCASMKYCRTPQGVRGLKYAGRGLILGQRGRTPQGVRGLKSTDSLTVQVLRGRTPQGVRGLKSTKTNAWTNGNLSHPARGAWIEIYLSSIAVCLDPRSHPARGAWIEI